MGNKWASDPWCAFSLGYCVHEFSRSLLGWVQSAENSRQDGDAEQAEQAARVLIRSDNYLSEIPFTLRSCVSTLARENGLSLPLLIEFHSLMDAATRIAEDLVDFHLNRSFSAFGIDDQMQRMLELHCDRLHAVAGEILVSPLLREYCHLGGEIGHYFTLAMTGRTDLLQELMTIQRRLQNPVLARGGKPLDGFIQLMDTLVRSKSQPLFDYEQLWWEVTGEDYLLPGTGPATIIQWQVKQLRRILDEESGNDIVLEVLPDKKSFALYGEVLKWSEFTPTTLSEYYRRIVDSAPRPVTRAQLLDVPEEAFYHEQLKTAETYVSLIRLHLRRHCIDKYALSHDVPEPDKFKAEATIRTVRKNRYTQSQYVLTIPPDNIRGQRQRLAHGG